jgi:TolB protein
VVATVPREGGALHVLTDGGFTSVNMPGSCHSAADRIVFSSDLDDEHDEIYALPLGGGDPERVTVRADRMAFEPTLSPDGQWVVFESHALDTEGDGAIFKVRADGTELTQLTDGRGDDRQPNWSPAGDLILFQSHLRVAGNVDIFVMDPAGGSLRNVTSSPSEETDASFSPDGRRIVYSSDEGGLDSASLFVLPVDGGTPTRISSSNGYDGAPSWSHDGSTIAFESIGGDPDGSAGTRIYLLAAPE